MQSRNLAYEVTSMDMLREILKGYTSFDAFDDALQTATADYPTWEDLPPKINIELNHDNTYGGSYKVLQISKQYLTQIERPTYYNHPNEQYNRNFLKSYHAFEDLTPEQREQYYRGY